MIGYLGDIIFQTNDKRILNFDNFKQSASASWAEHKMQGKKSEWEFLGPDSQSITFTMKLNANYGIKPRSQIEKLIKYVEEGKISPLVIGNKKIGSKWRTTKIVAVWDKIFNKGELVSASIDVTIEEYS